VIEKRKGKSMTVSMIVPAEKIGPIEMNNPKFLEENKEARR